jgi:hypothetical protein
MIEVISKGFIKMELTTGSVMSTVRSLVDSLTILITTSSSKTLTTIVY